MNEISIAIAAASISLTALIFSIYQTWLSRRHNYFSVAPMLDFSILSSESDKRYLFNITNKGLGPAIITDFVVLIKNKSIKEWQEDPGIKNYAELSRLLGCSFQIDWTQIPIGTVIKSLEK